MTTTKTDPSQRLKLAYLLVGTRLQGHAAHLTGTPRDGEFWADVLLHANELRSQYPTLSAELDKVFGTVAIPVEADPRLN